MPLRSRDSGGRHLRTSHALTGETLFEFAYLVTGQLTGVTDGGGNVTRVERDGTGNPVAVVSVSASQETNLIEGLSLRDGSQQRTRIHPEEATSGSSTHRQAGTKRHNQAEHDASPTSGPIPGLRCRLPDRFPVPCASLRA